MDRIELILVVCVISVISVIYLDNVFAEEYYTYYNRPFEKAPIVCITKPPPIVMNFTSKYELIKSVDEWETKLNNYTNSKDYSFQLFLPNTQEQYARCTVKIVFSNDFIGGGSGVTVGQASCNDIGIKQCTIIIGTNHLSVKAPVTNTIKHEFGHIIGLGHRQWDTIFDMARVVKSNDVMIYQNGLNRWILEDDLNALIAFYGDDGFGVHYPKYHFKYVIPN